MAAKFDNLDDVNTKFMGTICYHEGVPVYVKQALNGDNPGEFFLHVNALNQKLKSIKLEDKAFNYKNYNIGYVNYGQQAIWWFRKPIKQYRQGLKKDQMAVIMPNGYHPDLDMSFTFSKPVVNMLENSYPSVSEIKSHIRNGEATSIAFHKDFALAWDKLHNDFIIEYRGKAVGVGLDPEVKSFRLIAEHQHLNEALQEALA